jgi:uncharacterized protein YerC
MPNSLMKLSEILSLPRNKKDLGSLIQDLFTKQEIETVLERWEVLSFLLEGRTHR